MPEKKKQKEVTNEQLAEMIAKGFQDTATKQDVKAFNQKIDEVDERLGGQISDMDKRLIGVDERLTIVEHKLDKALYREFQRIDQLEGDMKIVKAKLGLAD